MELTHGLMGGSTSVIGKIIISTGMGSTRGQMEENTKASMSLTKSTATACINGVMVGDMKDNGNKENSTETESISYPMEIVAQAFGKMEKESSGSWPNQK